MTQLQSKQHAHELIERMAPSQVAAVVSLLETMLDPVAHAMAHASPDDEPESEEERQSVAASQAWFKQHPGEGIPFSEILSEFGLAPEDSNKVREPA